MNYNNKLCRIIVQKLNLYWPGLTLRHCWNVQTDRQTIRTTNNTPNFSASHCQTSGFSTQGSKNMVKNLQVSKYNTSPTAAGNKLKLLAAAL